MAANTVTALEQESRQANNLYSCLKKHINRKVTLDDIEVKSYWRKDVEAALGKKEVKQQLFQWDNRYVQRSKDVVDLLGQLFECNISLIDQYNALLHFASHPSPDRVTIRDNKKDYVVLEPSSSKQTASPAPEEHILSSFCHLSLRTAVHSGVCEMLKTIIDIVKNYFSWMRKQPDWQKVITAAYNSKVISL